MNHACPRSLRIAVLACLATLCIVFSSSSQAQQAAGEISFANSGAPAAQASFLRGLDRLHNFEYDAAAQQFVKAEQADPGFAMAYWGEAMTKNHPLWHEQDRAAAQQILTRLAATPEARKAKAKTEREQSYLQAVEALYGDGTKDERDLRYEAAMAALQQRYPDDVNAAAFHALSILGTAEQGRDFATYMRAAALLEEAFAAHPRHPGVVHYLIHCYDDPIHAPLGLRPARIYAKLSPDAGHAQHMTSHIFLAMGMWDDVVAANETAMHVVNQQRQKDGKPSHMCGHYSEWLDYAYLQQGRVEDARRLLGSCREEAMHEAGSGQAVKAEPLVRSYANMRSQFLINTRLWEDALVKEALPAGDFPFAQFTFDYATALSALERADLPAARSALGRLEADQQRCAAQEEKAPQEKEREQVLLGQLRALLTAREGKGTEAVQALRQVAASEQSMPLEFGPPFVDKPTEELLGELLLEQKQYAESRAAFSTALARAPGRRLTQAELAHAAAGAQQGHSQQAGDAGAGK